MGEVPQKVYCFLFVKLFDNHIFFSFYILLISMVQGNDNKKDKEDLLNYYEKLYKRHKEVLSDIENPDKYNKGIKKIKEDYELGNEMWAKIK
ncbi:MAG: hypothetical protein BWY04_00895 [candidate division CPR1 bacterium ADurb.Bin160]|uniref:Uncharacterized protein n=1 Tax=candidate division CPR1 bacterium ADurb.Bin160 TaxID=1852826 RepID=A0A1V5ZM87_9BACT|nr:MAG: hypothetical protein BWY04_00895 [candidate division CPR1 bacterium ADurb.Bin160]